MKIFADKVIPNCSICKWLALSKTGCTCCSAQAYNEAWAVYNNNNCKDLYEVKSK